MRWVTATTCTSSPTPRAASPLKHTIWQSAASWLRGPNPLLGLPYFRFKNLTYFIQTPDKVAAEYQVEALVVDTGKIYRQTYAGVLLAENGKIKLLREALDTLAASKAFSND
jgi:hypothetical protein